jgi:hypothetical protein
MSSIVVAGDSSGSITIAAPAVAGSGTLTLPVATDTLIGKATTDTLTNKSIAASQLTGTIAASALPAGSVLQVKSTTLKSNVSTTSVTATNLTGMAVTITPTSASNKILIQASLNVSINLQRRIYFTVTGGNAASYIGDAGTGHECAAAFCSRVNDDYIIQSTPLLYLDSPATTSAVTYQIQWWVESGTGYLNRSVTQDANGANPASTITVMEVQG